MNMVAYNVLLLVCWAYALVRGGTPEKIGATTLVVGSFLTGAAASAFETRFRSVEVGILIVDLLCVAAFLTLALRADRFWPSWVAALQIVGTAVHAARFVDPDIVGRTYAFMLAIWAYPMILLMIAGTWRHQQRLLQLGADKSWSRPRK